MIPSLPSDLYYTADHMWIRNKGPHLQIGLTDFAQSLIGSIIFIEVPSTGLVVEIDKPLGLVETNKAAADLISPVAGVVHFSNETLVSEPQRINRDPYGCGWLCEINPLSLRNLSDLLDPESYRRLVDEIGGIGA